MKRIGWIVGLAAGMAAAVCMGAVCRAETDDSGRYTYEIQDGKASILHYSWNEADTVLTIPDTLGGAPVTELAAGAFAECYAESVTLPAGVTYIGDNCFRDCGYLTEATLPKGLETIGASAFEDCILLKQVEIPDTVTEIETAAFSGTPWLEDRSQDVLIVGDGILLAYRGEGTAYEIPDTVHSIGDSAFANGTVLESVTIPDSVMYIREGAFDNCTALKEIAFPEQSNMIIRADALRNTLWFQKQPDGCVVIGSTLYRFKGSGTQAQVPDGVTVIGESAFEHTAVTSVILPDGVQEIRRAAFYGCENLRSITLPQGVRKIGTMGFYHCGSLTSVILPQGLEEIGDYAFASCDKLLYLAVPDSVTSLGSRCMGYTYVSGEEGFALEEQFRISTESSAAKAYAEKEGISLTAPMGAEKSDTEVSSMSMGTKRFLFGGIVLAGSAGIALVMLLMRRKAQKTTEK